MLDEAGQVVAQRDALDAPSWAWQAGDLILQIHPVQIPADLPPGTYQVVTGFYDRPTGERLPVVGGQPGATTAALPALQVGR